MESEKRLVGGGVLQRRPLLPALDFQHAGNQKKRETVGKNGLNLGDIQWAGLGFLGRDFGWVHIDGFIHRSANYRRFTAYVKTPGGKPAPFSRRQGLSFQLRMTESIDSQSVLPLLQFCEERQEEMLPVLKQAIELESPTDNKTAVDRLGKYLATEFERLDGKVSFYPQKQHCDHLTAELPSRTSPKPMLLL